MSCQLQLSKASGFRSSSTAVSDEMVASKDHRDLIDTTGAIITDRGISYENELT
jgi:hypothetical protein